MQPNTSWDLQWLTAPESGALQFPRGWSDLKRTQIPLPPGTGEGHIELFHLGQGMDIFRGTVTFEPAMAGQLVPMAEVKGTVPDPMFGVHSARLGHVTRARMTQIMNLRLLAPDIQEQLLFLPQIEAGRDKIHVRMLQPIAQVPDWRKQRRLWAETRSIACA